MGAASIAQQCIRADFSTWYTSTWSRTPQGVRFSSIGDHAIDLESTRAIEASGITRLTFRVVK